MHTKCFQGLRILLEPEQARGNRIRAYLGIFVDSNDFKMSVGSQSFHDLLSLEIALAR